MPLATKHDKLVTYHEGLPPIKSHEPLITWCGKLRNKLNNDNSTTRVTVAPKLCRMVTSLMGSYP